MNKQDLIKKAEVLEKELAELKDLINAPEKRVGRWKPKENDIYYYINTNGNAMLSINKSDIDKDIINFSPVFQTEKEAKEHSYRLIFNQKVIDRIAELNDGWEPDWSYDNIPKFIIAYREDIGKIFVESLYFTRYTSNEKYFKSMAVGETIIKEFDNEKLKNWFI